MDAYDDFRVDGRYIRVGVVSHPTLRDTLPFMLAAASHNCASTCGPQLRGTAGYARACVYAGSGAPTRASSALYWALDMAAPTRGGTEMENLSSRIGYIPCTARIQPMSCPQ